MELEDKTLIITGASRGIGAATARHFAEAGARVLKIERAEGDFARAYDHLVHGESAYFVWLNRGKESVCLDLREDADRKVFELSLIHI